MSRTIKRVVIKIGSSVILAYKMKRDEHLEKLVEQMSRLHAEDKEIILVSSGAIVLGMSELNQKTRPSDLASLQACAAVGQAVLMRTYSRLFEKYNIKCAQILLTWDDFENRTRHNNARHTLKALFNTRVIPIINENDTTSTEEIKVGDNDKLSALVAKLIHADALVMLSDVDGLYLIKDGKKEYLKQIREITKEIESHAADTANKDVSRGGMIAKLEAVKIATASHIPCVIASSGTVDVLESIVKDGTQVGTYFAAKEKNES